jgi:hypothetical protein
MKKIVLILIAALSLLNVKAQSHKTENLVIVTLDGFRWEELYRGADSALVNSKFTDDKDEINKMFWAPTPKERRAKLLPFFWSVISQRGQLYGNRDLGNKDEVANPYKFSYPGYNEIFTGFPDLRMNTNDPIPNPNMNVLEFLNKQKGFEGKVAAFSSWEVFPAILNSKRSGILVNSGYTDFTAPDANNHLKYLNSIQREVPKLLGEETRLDFLTYEYAMEYLKQYKPRVLYIAFDETDDLAHAGNYKLYLKEANKEDGFLKRLWEYIQSDPQYKDKTTLLITCDHGRGDVPLEAWTDHGDKTNHSEQTWFAVIGPDTPSRGEIKTSTTTYHKQLAQTLSTLLGFDFKAHAGHEAGDAIQTVAGK